VFSSHRRAVPRIGRNGEDLPTTQFLQSNVPLQMGDAVAAFLCLEDGRYLLQLRDDAAHIWYPGFWGLFGGGIESGEDLIAALRRELREELELDLGEAHLFTSFAFDLQTIGRRTYYRHFFEVPVTATAWQRVVLREGSEVGAFTGEEALSLPRLSPYDAFALFMFHQRRRLAAQPS
jgi:8-oxo-dGTP pyrophosphatase MutT (NUDIX family)